MYHLTILWLIIAAAAYVVGRRHGRSALRRELVAGPVGDLVLGRDPGGSDGR